MSGSESSETSQNISSQLAFLVPSFDPSKDDLQVFKQKVQLVHAVWPRNKVSELITRLILNTSGSAFAKLQLHQEELCVNDEKGVKRLIELLGGHWGKMGLEKKYSDAEKALFQCVQQSDASHDSYLARADILWTKLSTQKLQLEDLQAYITLRGSLLTSDDKKRVILESDSSLEGKLTINRVQEAIRLLGTSFFQEMTGLNKRSVKTKVYDQVNVTADDHEHAAEMDDASFATSHEEILDDEMIEVLVAEGDEDASFVADFEQAATEVLQNDPELAPAYSTYVEARKKLSEKVKSRGFWPVKGRGKGFKGKGKTKNNWFGRKSLQQRILETNCRICGRKGHWKSECPQRQQSNTGSSSSAPVTLSIGANDQSFEEVMPMEFMMLPEVSEEPPQDQHSFQVECFVQSSFFQYHQHSACPTSQVNTIEGARDRIKSYIKGNKGDNSKVASLVNRIESRLRSKESTPTRCPEQPNDASHVKPKGMPDSTAARSSCPDVQTASEISPEICTAEAVFSTHDTWGIIDTGATKTVIGSQHVQSFLQNLETSVKNRVKRCKCDVVFRFGNQGTLKSEHAMMVPVFGLGLKIAVVPGATPFLLSNTLMRALGACIDTAQNMLIIPKHQVRIPLKVSSKGLYLIDMNTLIQAGSHVHRATGFAETFAQDSASEQENSQRTSRESGSSNNCQAVSPKHTQNVPHSGQQSESQQLSQDQTRHVIKSTCQDATQVNKSENACPSMQHPNQSDPIRSNADQPQTDHERLDTAPRKSPGLSASRGVRGCQPSDNRRAEVRSDDIRQGSPRPNVRAGVEHQSRMDSVVSPALSEQWQDFPQEDGALHQVEDRRSGDQPRDRSPEPGDAQKSCCPKGNDQPSQSQGTTRTTDGTCRIGTTSGRTLDAIGRCQRAESSRTNGDGRECLAADPHALGPESSARSGQHRSVPHDADRGRVERSLVPMNQDAIQCDLALSAGEIDTFCESCPTKNEINSFD